MSKLLFYLPLGVFSHALLPSLPAVPWLITLLAGCILAACHPRGRLAPVFVVAGLALGGLWGHQQLGHRLPVELDKSDALVTGRVSSLVATGAGRTRFEYEVVAVQGSGARELPALRKLLLSWYGETAIAPGELWQLSVRLRSPRGFANPGASDYSAWLLAEGFSATGYVRTDPRNRRLAAASPWSLQGYRQQLLDRLLARQDSAPATGFMAALILGEHSLIPRDMFARLVATGTVHLMVVSGLHVSMVAALCVLLGTALGRCGAAVGCPLPARLVAVPIAAAGALAYGAVAGFGLPVQRALIMTLAVLLALVVRRRSSLPRIFGLALCGVALVDPLAATRPGFWLSFIAVAGLLLWFVPRPRGHWGPQLVAAQGVVFVSLAPWLLYFQGAVTPVALPLNLLVIPWVSTLVVPTALAGALLQGVPALGGLLWDLAAAQLALFGDLLSWLDGAPAVLTGATAGGWRLPAGNLWVLAVLVLLGALLLLPRGLGRGGPLAVLAMAVAVARPTPGPQLELTVLDVGQGLAAVVRVGDRVLVYDTGPGYPSGFNTGDAVVAPFLATLGVPRIDHLILSHGDLDHVGGAAGLLARKPAVDILAGQPERLSGIGARPCRAGERWQWQGVEFRLLWPPAPGTGPPGLLANNNNNSCVLLISYKGILLLLPGDIEAQVEDFLVSRGPLAAGPEVDVLIASHHGSKTSSSAGFVAATRPRHAVFASGFNHHFGHPHPDVEARFAALGSRLWRTAQSGALSFRWDGDGRLEIAEYRRQHTRYWH